MAEYLEFDQQFERKSEYFDGQIVLMAGASSNHNLIVMSASFAFYGRLHGKGCFIFSSDMRVKMEATGSYAYPDLSIVCGQPAYEESNPQTLLNPTVIIEILSPSTEQHDRGRKLRHYRTLDSLQDYILISQTNYHIEHFARQPEDSWLLTDIIGRDASLTLTSLDCQIALDEIYEQVQLSAES
ncbi:MAG: Uma2 family endonuclease [Chloroflexi bacterium]|nr:Uma2 family endonuclease [Chloroflexota bacterium]